MVTTILKDSSNNEIVRNQFTSSGCVAPPPADPLYNILASYTGKNNGDMGDMKDCINNKYQYCSLNSLILTSGICVPNNCGVADVTNTTSTIFTNFIAKVFPSWALVPLLNIPITAFCGDGSIPWDSKSVSTIVVLSILLLTVLYATAYVTVINSLAPNKPSKPILQIFLQKIALQTTLPPLFNEDKPCELSITNVNLGVFDGVRVLSMSMVLLGHAAYVLLFAPMTPADRNAMLNFAYSPAGQVIPSAEYAVDSFFCLSGALATYFLVSQIRKQVNHHDNIIQNFDSSTANAPLLSLNNMNAENETIAKTNFTKNKRLIYITCRTWIMAIIHRYLRIVPSLAIFLLIWTFLAPSIFAYGPYAFGWNSIITTCTDHGWTNLLFLQNFIPTETNNGICAPHTWYLAPEFQLFAVLAVPISALYVFSPIIGWIGIIITTIASLISCLVVAFYNKAEYLPTNNQDFNGDYNGLFYIKPWTRAPAFIVGLALGLALRTWERETISLTAKDTENEIITDEKITSNNKGNAISQPITFTYIINSLLIHILPSKSKDKHIPSGLRQIDTKCTITLMTALLIIGILFYTPSSQYTAIQNNTTTWPDILVQLHTAFSRWLWSICLAIILYLSATNRGGLLGYCLSHRFWRPMARLSYWMYLIHFLWYQIIVNELTGPIIWSGYTLTLMYCGGVIISALASAFFYLIVEIPFAVSQRLILMKDGRSNSSD